MIKVVAPVFRLITVPYHRFLSWLFPVGRAPAVDPMQGYHKSHFTGKPWRKRFAMVALFVICFVYIALFVMLPTVLALPFLLPVIAMTLVTIWALPVTKSKPTKVIEICFWGFFITLLMWPNYIALTLPGLPWITFLRIFGIPLLVILLYFASTSQPFRQGMGQLLSSTPWISRLLAAFAVVQALSILVSSTPFETVNRVFANQIAWTCMFYAAVWVFRKPGNLDRWIIAYQVMIGILCVMAAYEARVAHVLFQNVPSFMLAKDEVVGRILAGYHRLTGEYRVITTATTPLSCAEFLALTIPLMYYSFMRWPTFKVRFAIVILEVLLTYAIYQTYARLGFVGWIIGHLGCGFYHIYDYRRRKPDSPLALLMVLSIPVIAAMTAAAVLFIGRIHVLVLGSGQHQYSDQARKDQWALFPKKIIDDPFLGFGAANGANKLGFTNPSGILTVDSYYLLILMDYGFIGFFVFYGMILSGMGAAFRNLRFASDHYRTMNAAFLIFLLEFLVIKGVLSQEANHPLLFMILAGVCASTYHGGKKQAPQPDARNVDAIDLGRSTPQVRLSG